MTSPFFGEEWTLLSTRIPGGKRFRCAYASLDDKRHFLLGGWDANGRSSTVVEYNSTSQNFHTHPPLPEERSWSSAIAIDDDRLIVVGGSPSSTAKSCCVYDTRSEEWSTDWPLLNIGRLHHASVYTTNKKVYVIGGCNEKIDPLDSIEEIDLSLPTASWRVLPQRLNKKRNGCCAIAHPKNPNNIIVVGGYNKNDKCLRCCEMMCLDPTQEGQTRRLPSMMTPRAGHTLVLVENRFVVAMGGFNGSQYLSSVEYLDLEEEAQEQQQWRPLPSMNNARSSIASFYSPKKHKIVVAGGYRLDTVEELPVLFRGHARSHRQLREPPRPRGLPSGVMDAPHRTRIQRWLDETEEQMIGFIEHTKGRERELIQERQENRQRCNDYKALINEKLRQATGISSWMADSRSAGRESYELARPHCCT